MAQTQTLRYAQDGQWLVARDAERLLGCVDVALPPPGVGEISLLCECHLILSSMSLDNVVDFCGSHVLRALANNCWEPGAHTLKYVETDILQVRIRSVYRCPTQ